MRLRMLIGLYLFSFATVALAEHRYRYGEFIVKLKDSSVNAKDLKGSSARAHNFRATQNFFGKARSHANLKVKNSWSGLNMHHMTLDTSAGQTMSEALDSLNSLEEVEYAEPNWIVDILDDGLRNNLPLQLFDAGQIQNMGVGSFGMTGAAIQADPTWPSLTNDGNAVVVAIIDTGVTMTHSVFTTYDAIWTNPGEIAGNGIDDDKNGYVDDVHGWNFVKNSNDPTDDEGHGTHVAGIVLGTGTDIFNLPSTPLATEKKPKVKIMPLKFLDPNGSGTTADAIKAIYYAVNNGARVLNNSWGGGAFSQSLMEAIAYSYQKDAVFVAASGNSKNNNDSNPTFPANYNVPNVISIAATDDSDVLASFSNYGATTVHLASPGVGILSTYPKNGYAYLSGTSMAAPFVSGVVGLMMHESPKMNCYQIKNLALTGVDLVGGLGSKVVTSSRTNVYKSVSSAKAASVDSAKPGYLLSVSGYDRNIASSMARRGGGCGMVMPTGKGIEDNPLNNHKNIALIITLLMVPISVAQVLRSRVTKSNGRRFDRYAIDSTVSFKIGDQELSGCVRSISMGGSDLNTDALLEQGSIITMSISSPDGKSQIQVQGNVVWSESQKRYGIAFQELTDQAKAEIHTWAQGLQKIS